MKENHHNQPDDHGETAAMLMNPYYAITLYPGLFGEHPPLANEDDWVKANAKLIEQLGTEAYLRQLLAVLKGDYPRQPDDTLGE
ncbi:MAG: hypothetical protein LC776_05915 [Acidobacteria bacterium]|nr:hypothetical protein [Acidobacteriota bacterium]